MGRRAGMLPKRDEAGTFREPAHGGGFGLLIPTETLESECALVHGLLDHLFGKKLPYAMRQRVEHETNALLKKGISKKERVSLDSYLEDIRSVLVPARRANDLAKYTMTLRAIGAFADLDHVHDELWAIVRALESRLKESSTITADSTLTGRDGILKSKEVLLGHVLEGCTVARSLLQKINVGAQEEERDALLKMEKCCSILAGGGYLPGWHFPEAVLKDVNMARERDDPMKINEIRVRFIAASLPRNVRAVHFSAKFYTLARTSTLPLHITNSDLNDQAEDGSRKTNTGLDPLLQVAAGGELVFSIDHSDERSAGADHFSEYMQGEAALVIDVFDSEAGFSLGTIQVPDAQRLLRQGRPSSSMSCACELLPPPPPPPQPCEGGTCGRMASMPLARGCMIMLRCENRGLLPKAGSRESERNNKLRLKSWRASAIEGKESLASPRTMQGISVQHVRKWMRVKQGEIAGGGISLVPLTKPDAAAPHLQALKMFRANLEYSREYATSALRALSSREHVVRPSFGESPHRFSHVIKNPHSHPVTCRVMPSGMHFDNVKPRARDKLKIVLEPPVLWGFKNDEVTEGFNIFLQPLAEIRVHMTLTNDMSAYSEEEYGASYSVVLSRVQGDKDIASEYQLKVIVRPLPIIFDRFFRFFHHETELHVEIEGSLNQPFTTDEHAKILMYPNDVEGFDAQFVKFGDDSKKSVSCSVTIDLEKEQHEGVQPVLEAALHGSARAPTSYERKNCTLCAIVVKNHKGEVRAVWLLECYRVLRGELDAAKCLLRLGLGVGIINDASSRVVCSGGKEWGDIGMEGRMIDEEAAASHNGRPVTIFVPASKTFTTGHVYLNMSSPALAHQLVARRADELRERGKQTLIFNETLVADEAAIRVQREKLQVVKSVLSRMNKDKVLVPSREDAALLRDSGVGGYGGATTGSTPGSWGEWLRQLKETAETEMMDARKAAATCSLLDPTTSLRPPPSEVWDAEERQWVKRGALPMSRAVVHTWFVMAQAPGAKATEGQVATVQPVKRKHKRRSGPRPRVKYTSMYHTWKVSPSPTDADAARAQAQANDRCIFAGTTKKKIAKSFSPLPHVQSVVLRYEKLSKQDCPKGPFIEAVKAACKIFFLRPPDSKRDQTGYLMEQELLAAITDVPLSCMPNSAGGETIVMQAPNEADARVLVLDAGKVANEPTLLEVEKRRKARKKVSAGFCKLYSWGWGDDGKPLLYNGRGLSRSELKTWKAADCKPPWDPGSIATNGGTPQSFEASADGSYVDGANPKAEPIEVVVIVAGGLHLAPGGPEYVDFILDQNPDGKGTQPTPALFKQYYPKSGGAMPLLSQVKEDTAALGFVNVRQSGPDLVGRRVSLFSDSMDRHGWNVGTVQKYEKDEKGVFVHTITADDGFTQKLDLDSLPAHSFSLLPPASAPTPGLKSSSDVLLNSRALFVCLCEDLQMALEAFCCMVRDSNKRSARVPPWAGYLKANCIESYFYTVMGTRKCTLEVLCPILREALYTVLLEDKGNLHCELCEIELPEHWMGHFPKSIGAIKCRFGTEADVLMFPHDALWHEPDLEAAAQVPGVLDEDLSKAKGRVAGILCVGESFCMPGNSQSTANPSGLCESAVGAHTDIRLVTSFWYNKHLFKPTNWISVRPPLCAVMGLKVHEVIEAKTLFASMDTDASGMISGEECSAFLVGMGYLDFEVEAFFEMVDANMDGQISWQEFLVGAISLYRDEVGGDTGPKSAKEVLPKNVAEKSLTLPVAVQGKDQIDLTITPSMTWDKASQALFQKIGGEAILEYTDVVVLRDAMTCAFNMFDTMDRDGSGTLDRKEMVMQLSLPRDSGGWGFQDYQVDDFVRSADVDNSGTVDRREFLDACVKHLLTDRQGRQGVGSHRFSGREYAMETARADALKRPRKSPVRLRVRGTREWAAFRDSLFPTKKEVEEQIVLRQRELGLGNSSDLRAAAERSKVDLERARTALTRAKRAEQRVKSRGTHAEMEAQMTKSSASVEKVGEGDGSKADAEGASTDSKDQEPQISEDEKRFKEAEDAAAKEVEDAEREVARCTNMNEAAGRAIEDAEEESKSAFVAEMMKTLERMSEEQLRLKCAECNDGRCVHESHSRPEETETLAKAVYAHRYRDLMDKKAMVEAWSKDQMLKVNIEVSAIRTRSYSLRCLLHDKAHPASAHATEISNEWKQVVSKDQSSPQSWLNTFTHEKRSEAPSEIAVLKNEQTKANFLRKFKAWPKAGRLISFSDTTSWDDLKKAVLRELFLEETKLTYRRWTYVRDASEWETLKQLLLLNSVHSAPAIVVRERVAGGVASAPGAALGLQCSGWEARAIELKGWKEEYDVQKAKFCYVRDVAEGKKKGDPLWAPPLDHLQDIKWGDGAITKGIDVRKALGAPPTGPGESRRFFWNTTTGMLSWKLHTNVCDAASVRVSGIKKKPDNGVIPILFLKSDGSDNAEVEITKKPFEMKYSITQDKILGGFVMHPLMEWDELRRLLRDEVPTTGVESSCTYLRDGKVMQVRNDKEWGDCLTWILCQMRAFLLAGVSGASKEIARPAFRLYPKKLRSFTLELLDSRQPPEKGLSNAGTVTFGQTEFEIRSKFLVLEDMSWQSFLEESGGIMKERVVFKYLKPYAVVGDSEWLQCYETMQLAGKTGESVNLRGNRGCKVEITLKFSAGRESDLGSKDPKNPNALEILLDESTTWEQLLFALCEATRERALGLTHTGRDVRDETAWRAAIGRVVRETPDRTNVANLSTPDVEAANKLPIFAGGVDGKGSALDTELLRRRAAGRAFKEPGAGGDRVLKLELRDCRVKREADVVMVMEGEIEAGLRTFKLDWRASSSGEGRKQGRGQEEEAEGDSVMEVRGDTVLEVIRRTKKGALKQKGSMLFRDGLQIFHGGRASQVSCCERAAEGEDCCKGLLWDIRSTILHRKVALTEGNNAFRYYGPHAIGIPGGEYTLTALADLIWKRIEEKGLHPKVCFGSGRQLEVCEGASLAEGWKGGDGKYVHVATGREAPQSFGAPRCVTIKGSSEFRALFAWDLCSLGKAIVWDGKGVVEVISKNNTLVYAGPHEVILPINEYDLAALQSVINAAVLKNGHVARSGGELPTSAPVFALAADRAGGIPRGWGVRVYDPQLARDPSDPVPPFSGNRTGRSYYVHTGLAHAQWEPPYYRVQLEISQGGFQADMRPNGCLRGVLGFEPSLYPQAFPESRTSVRCVAAGPPRALWHDVQRMLGQVVGGTVDLHLECDCSPLQGFLSIQEVKGKADMEARRINNAKDWRELLDALQRQAMDAERREASSGGDMRSAPHSVAASAGEVQTELILLKKASSDARRKALGKM